jgi:hypothetical protein
VRKNLLIVGIFTLVTLITAGCGSSDTVANSKTAKSPQKSTTIVSGSAGNGLTVSLANADGIVHRGPQDFTMTFFDPKGDVAKVNSATLTFHVGPFGSLPEENIKTTFIPTGVPGSFHGKADLMRLGEWEAQISYEGTTGSSSFTLPIVVK